MEALFISIIAALLISLLVIVAKNLLKNAASRQKSTGFVVIPVFNGMENLSLEVKSVCWDEAFKGSRGRRVLLVPTDVPDAYTKRELERLKSSFDRLYVVNTDELSEFIIDDTRIFEFDGK